MWGFIFPHHLFRNLVAYFTHNHTLRFSTTLNHCDASRKSWGTAVFLHSSPWEHPFLQTNAGTKKDNRFSQRVYLSVASEKESVWLGIHCKVMTEKEETPTRWLSQGQLSLPLTLVGAGSDRPRGITASVSKSLLHRDSKTHLQARGHATVVQQDDDMQCYVTT